MTNYISPKKLDLIISQCNTIFPNRNIYFFKALFYLVYYTGIGKNDLFCLKRELIDFERKRICLEDRTVFFNDRVAEILKKYMDAVPNEPIVFSMTEGKIQSLNKDLYTIYTGKVGLDLFRKSLVSMMVSKKMPLETIVKLMGANNFSPKYIYNEFYKNKPKLNYIEKMYRRKII